MPPEETAPEVWMRGPVAGVPALLQPAAHALLQAREEIELLLNGFDNRTLWFKPYGMASVGFHLQHIAGVLDRMQTYARGNALTEEQFRFLASEAGPENPECTAELLAAKLFLAIENFIEMLKQTDEKTITASRGVGRKQYPSTVSGLLFHAAEHTQRHLGQLIVTVKIAGKQDLMF